MRFSKKVRNTVTQNWQSASRHQPCGSIFFAEIVWSKLAECWLHLFLYFRIFFVLFLKRLTVFAVKSKMIVLLNRSTSAELQVRHSLSQSVETSRTHTLSLARTQNRTQAGVGEPDVCWSVDSRLQRRSCSLSAPAGLLARVMSPIRGKSFECLFHFALDCNAAPTTEKQSSNWHRMKKKKVQRPDSVFLAKSLME